ncbi:hypothetical protein TNCV_2492801 [Trichonephila clavipes]|uniref:Uncharacterized protein n=1 Tax=Trichonephila clavipes TaxID=2585209 RepID=A0A8X6RUH1_TRICX|nr:hypothetical protein TNCV_2492801 [Trichonephila clavipes]
MDFTEINCRGKRGKLLGRIDRQNSRFRASKTTIIKFGLHASFVELGSAKNAVNERARKVGGYCDWKKTAYLSSSVERVQMMRCEGEKRGTTDLNRSERPSDLGSLWPGIAA